MKKNQFTIIYTKEKSWIVARCLEIDIVSQGKTQRSAERNIKEAISLYLESFGDTDIPQFSIKPIIKKISLPHYDSDASSIGRKTRKVSSKARL